MRKILQIENLKISFNMNGEKIQAVKGVSLNICKGETYALVGESGCGKTSLCRTIMRLHSGNTADLHGCISLSGRNLMNLTDKEMEKIRGKEISMIFQNPATSLDPTYTVGRLIMEPILLHEKVSKKEALRRALRLLKLTGIDNPEMRIKQHPHNFSGGMMQRVAIAIALATNPKILIADEPTTALDKDIQKQILDLLKEIQRKTEISIIFITHNLGIVKNFADRVAVMKDGIIVEDGYCKDIFENPQHSYTKELLHYANYEKSYNHHLGSQYGKTIVKVEHLNKYFELGNRRAIKVLDDISLEIRQGEIVGIIGPSGTGKSTLAKCMMGIYKVSSGSIRYEENLQKQMIFQDSTSAFNPRMKIRDIIAEPLMITNSGMKRKHVFEQVFYVMSQVGLDITLAERYPYDISGGQRQRAAIARALITNPDFIIADEPTSSLDVSLQAQIIHLLKKIHDECNLTIMIISHDIAMTSHISNRIIEMG